MCSGVAVGRSSTPWAAHTNLSCPYRFWMRSTVRCCHKMSNKREQWLRRRQQIKGYILCIYTTHWCCWWVTPTTPLAFTPDKPPVVAYTLVHVRRERLRDKKNQPANMRIKVRQQMLNDEVGIKHLNIKICMNVYKMCVSTVVFINKIKLHEMQPERCITFRYTCNQNAKHWSGHNLDGHCEMVLLMMVIDGSIGCSSVFSQSSYATIRSRYSWCPNWNAILLFLAECVLQWGGQIDVYVWCARNK